MKSINFYTLVQLATGLALTAATTTIPIACTPVSGNVTYATDIKNTECYLTTLNDPTIAQAAQLPVTTNPTLSGYTYDAQATLFANLVSFVTILAAQKSIPNKSPYTLPATKLSKFPTPNNFYTETALELVKTGQTAGTITLPTTLFGSNIPGFVYNSKRQINYNIAVAINCLLNYTPTTPSATPPDTSQNNFQNNSQANTEDPLQMLSVDPLSFDQFMLPTQQFSMPTLDSTHTSEPATASPTEPMSIPTMYSPDTSTNTYEADLANVRTYLSQLTDTTTTTTATQLILTPTTTLTLSYLYNPQASAEYNTVLYVTTLIGAALTSSKSYSIISWQAPTTGSSSDGYTHLIAALENSNGTAQAITSTYFGGQIPGFRYNENQSPRNNLLGAINAFLATTLVTDAMKKAAQTGIKISNFIHATNCNATDSDGQTALMIACKATPSTAVAAGIQQLMNIPGINLATTDMQHNTAYFYINQKLPILQANMKNCLNYSVLTTGKAQLQWQLNYNAANTLLQTYKTLAQKLNASLVSGTGLSASMIQALQTRTTIAQVFNSTNCNLTDNAGHTPLIITCQRPVTSLADATSLLTSVSLLLSFGANPLTPDLTSKTALSYLTQQTKVLLENQNIVLFATSKTSGNTRAVLQQSYNNYSILIKKLQAVVGLLKSTSTKTMLDGTIISSNTPEYVPDSSLSFNPLMQGAL